MKILQIHTKLVSGGIEAIVCGLANEMAKTEDVTVCSIFKPNTQDVFFERLAPEVKKINLGKTRQGISFKEIFSIYRLIKKGKYDAINIHGCFQYYFLAVIFLHYKTRFFYTIHSDALKENLTTTKIFHWLKRICFKYNWMRAITISDESQKSFYNLYKCNSTLITNGVVKPIVHSNNITIDKYKINYSTRIFLHPGRITKAKNQVVLCEVFKKLTNEGEDVVLLIAGMAEDKFIYSQLETYFSDRIIYLGERNDVTELLANVDGCCLPSIWEGLPVTLLEALSVSCIPICSPVGGIVNVIKDGVNGFLSKSSSFDDYYQVMKRVLSLKENDFINIKKNCAQSFEPYNIESTSRKYINFYSKAKL